MVKIFLAFLYLMIMALGHALSAPLPRTVQFACPGDLRFSVEFKGEKEERAVIRDWNNRHYEVRKTPATAGIRYTSSHVIFGQQGRAAFLTLGDVLHDKCRLLSPSNKSRD